MLPNVTGMPIIALVACVTWCNVTTVRTRRCFHRPHFDRKDKRFPQGRNEVVDGELRSGKLGHGGKGPRCVSYGVAEESSLVLFITEVRRTLRSVLVDLIHYSRQTDGVIHDLFPPHEGRQAQAFEFMMDLKLARIAVVLCLHHRYKLRIGQVRLEVIFSKKSAQMS